MSSYGPYSDEQWTTTSAQPSTPQGVILYDDFATYAENDSVADRTPPVNANGARWAGRTGHDLPKVVSGGYGGDANALGFRFSNRNDGDGPYTYGEQKFHLCDAADKAINEIWADYYIYWPSEFRPAQTGKMKCIMFHADQFGDENTGSYSGGHSSWHEADNYRSFDRLIVSQNIVRTWGTGFKEGRTNWGHAVDGYTSPPHSGDYGTGWNANYSGSNHYNPSYGTDKSSVQKCWFDRSADAGQWRRYRWHIKCSPAVGVYTAVFRAWKDGTKIAEITDNDFFSPRMKLDMGYLFGWNSLGVETACTVKVSRFTLFASDPEWSDV